MKKQHLLNILLSVLILSSCASNQINYDDQYSQKDPYEKVNRVIFKFNYAADRVVLRPLAKGYRAVTNQYTRDRVKNFFSNLNEPVSIINHGLQGELKDTSIATGRFVVNSTIGVLGLYDVATKIGLEKNTNRLDQTLEKYCVDEGPYLMIPVLGPTTPRGIVGQVGDGFMSPIYWATQDGENGGDTTFYGTKAAQAVIIREDKMEMIDEIQETSLDLYAKLRSIYYQNRPENKCKKHQEENKDNYDFEFDDFEDYEE